AAELYVNISELPDSAYTQLPVATGMATDQGQVGKAPGQEGNIFRCGLASRVGASRSARLTTHLIPGVNVNKGVQLGGLADDRILVRRGGGAPASITAVILDADTWPVGNPFLDLLAAAQGIGRINGD